MLELCQRFGTSLERQDILKGLLRWRSLLHNAGFESGWQWIDGSFVENIEVLEKRAPNDMDMVTFHGPPDQAKFDAALLTNPAMLDWNATKTCYKLDHYCVDLSEAGHAVAENARYWGLLFSHRRDGVWKGMLRVELNTPNDDKTAVDWLSQNSV